MWLNGVLISSFLKIQEISDENEISVHRGVILSGLKWKFTMTPLIWNLGDMAKKCGYFHTNCGIFVKMSENVKKFGFCQIFILLDV